MRDCHIEENKIPDWVEQYMSFLRSLVAMIESGGGRARMKRLAPRLAMDARGGVTVAIIRYSSRESSSATVVGASVDSAARHRKR